ncbi:MAG TPA: hypothetical protein VGR72_00965 [Candidatus Acidoferrales bacterium]|nr:hypothetical protein [Candidatus Acidoferrales bacterium]
MGDIAVILNEISCVDTSYGPGDDDIYIVTELWDLKNTQAPLIKRTLSHIGNMGAGSKKTQRENPNLGPPSSGDRANYLAWVPPKSGSLDSLACYMLVIKAGPFTSYKTGKTDSYDTNDEAQKAERDITSDMQAWLEKEKKIVEDEIAKLQSEVASATGQKLKDIQNDLARLRAKLHRLNEILQKVGAGLAVGGEIVQFVLDIISVVLFIKKSAGETVALGQNWWNVPIPQEPVNGLHPIRGTHDFTCNGYGGVYNVKYHIAMAGW